MKVMLLFLTLSSIQTDSLKLPDNKKFFGIQVGINSSRIGQKYYPVPKIFTKSISYEVGVAFDILRRKHYSQRLGYLYRQKTIREDFISSNKKIYSEIKFKNLSIYYYPLIFKIKDNNKFNPYLAVGVFGSYTFRINALYKINNTYFAKDVYLIDYIKDRPYDYGLKLASGFYFYQNPIEISYEIGFSKMLPKSSTNSNLILYVSIF